MPTPGQFDPATGAIWDGAKWEGGSGKAPATPGTSAAAPFPGAVLRQSSPDGTQGWLDPQTGQTHFYRAGKEIGSSDDSAKKTTTAPTAPEPPKYDPAGTAGGIPGMTNLQTDSFRAAAKTALQQLGVLDYVPTNDELRSFFTQGFDAEGIANYYMTDPTFLARQPGLPYGLSRDTFEQRSKQLQQAFKGAFGQDAPGLPGATATKGERESNLFGYALKQGIDPSTFGSTLEQYRRTQGKAPASASEYASFTAQQASSQREAGAQAGFAQPKAPAQQHETRAAVGGRKA